MSIIIKAIKLMAIDLPEAHLLLPRQVLYPAELRAHVIFFYTLTVNLINQLTTKEVLGLSKLTL